MVKKSLKGLKSSRMPAKNTSKSKPVASSKSNAKKTSTVKKSAMLKNKMAIKAPAKPSKISRAKSRPAITKIAVKPSVKNTSNKKITTKALVTREQARNKPGQKSKIPNKQQKISRSSKGNSKKKSPASKKSTPKKDIFAMIPEPPKDLIEQTPKKPLQAFDHNFDFQNHDFPKSKTNPELPDLDALLSRAEMMLENDSVEQNAKNTAKGKGKGKKKSEKNIISPTSISPIEQANMDTFRDFEKALSSKPEKIKTQSDSPDAPEPMMPDLGLPLDSDIKLEDIEKSEPTFQKKSIWQKLFGKKEQKNTQSGLNIQLQSIKKKDSMELNLPKEGDHLELPELEDFNSFEPKKSDLPISLTSKDTKSKENKIPAKADPVANTASKAPQNDQMDAFFSKEKTKEMLNSAKTDLDAECHHLREKEFIENMKRHADHEIRERMINLREQEQQLNERKDALDRREANLEANERDLLQKEQELTEVQKVKEEVDNQHVSIQYQKQKIEELKSELALKDAMLREKEIELDRREEELRKTEEIKRSDVVIRKENEQLKVQVNEEDDAIEYLQIELEKQRKEFEEQLKNFHMENIQSIDRFSKIHELITHCYLELSQNDVPAVKDSYIQLKEEYAKVKEYDLDKSVQKEIIKLYEDIKRKFRK